MSRCFTLRISSLTAVVAVTAATIVPFTTPSANAVPNRLDQDTDVAVTISAPDVVVVGATFRAVVSVTNLGKTTARALSCSIATPRLDAVTNFRVGATTRPVVEPVEGSESRSFKIASLGSGQMRSLPVTGTAIKQPSMHGFALSGVCTPTPADSNQANNSAFVKIALVEG